MAETTNSALAGAGAKIHRLVPAGKGAPSRKHRRAVRALRRQAGSAAGNGAVGLMLMALSLTHTAHGTAIVTGAEAWESWAMSAGIDLAYVSLKLTLLTASERVRKQIGKLAEAAIIGTLIGSAAMNIFAFTAAATNIYTRIAGALLGAAIPALLYVVTQVGAAAWIDVHGRAA
jgi:hypothetical protein